MGLEIEHKYLVKDDSYKKMSVKNDLIIQGYISRDKNRTVRIRVINDEAFVTIKGDTCIDRRAEYETPISKNDAMEIIKNLCIPPIIEKIRYIVEHEGKKWEVDEFHGNLKGLVIAEIELKSSDEKYSVPSFIGNNVTGDPRYYNSNLDNFPDNL